MNRWIVLGVFLGAAALAAVVWQARRASEQDGAKETGGPAGSTVALGVGELMKDPDRFRGEIRVEGVVSAVSSEDGTLALIDLSEFEECGVTTCAALVLPVRWDGVAPAVEDRVRLSGEVREDADGKLVFVARTLDTVRADGEEHP